MRYYIPLLFVLFYIISDSYATARNGNFNTKNVAKIGNFYKSPSPRNQTRKAPSQSSTIEYFYDNSFSYATSFSYDTAGAPTRIPTKSPAPVLTLPPVKNGTYCSSIPAYFTWQLNFSSPCEPANIKYGPGTGIQRYTCGISSPDSSITDLTPVSIRGVQIIELDKNLTAVNAEKQKTLNLTDGDLLNYTSIAATNPDIILGGISMKLIGDNIQGDEVNLLWTVQYRNSTSNAIVFCPGNSIGWANFTQLNFLLCR